MAHVDNLIVNKYGANCVVYWPLNRDGVALKGGIDLTLTDVTFAKGMAVFNGTTSFGISASNVDLSTATAITLIAKVKFKTYNLSAIQAIVEHTVNGFAANAGGFLLYQDGTNADKGVAFGGNCNATNEARYSNATFGWSTKGELFFACTFDTALAAAVETNMYSFGTLLTASSRTSNNNTAGFKSAKTYVGSRAGSSIFLDGSVSNVAIFNRVLTTNEIKEIHYSINNDGYAGIDYFTYILDDGERDKPYRYGD